MHVVIRTDGSYEIGYGHLVRSSTLARELITRGHDVTFVTVTGPQTASVAPDAASLRQIDAESVPENPLWIDSVAPDCVVVDGDRFETEYYDRLRDSVATVAAIVDDARTKFSVDVLIDENIYADSLLYEWVPPKPKLCLGLEYLIIRDEFASLAEKEAPWRDSPECAIVIMGGVDKENQTPIAVRAFDSFDVSVTAIVGPGYENEAEIREAARETSADVEVVKDPDNLAEMMFQADFAVSTLGTTVYELIATRTPIIGIPDNQTPIDTVLAETDLAQVLDWHTTDDEIEARIEQLVDDTDLRRKMWEASANVITGDGPENIADELESTCTNC